MHIPDGYLGPRTYAAAYAAMVPVWAWASARARRTLALRQAPMLALAAAFTFVVMMFNIPVPGGTSGHAVGAVLVAILLGPAAAVIAVSLALAVQALIFGDGGITTFAANCLTMAVAMPLAGVWTFRALAGGASASSRRARWAAAAAGYFGLNAAAFLTAVLLGLQPALGHDAAGRPLYCPFGLGVAIPAMAVTHLLAFGLVEAVVTAGVLAFLARTDATLALGCYPREVVGAPSRRLVPRLVLLVVGLVLLSPLGLYLPARFGGGTAWGEWSAAQLKALTGSAPAGIERAESAWRAPLPDYVPAGKEDAPLKVQGIWYVVSGALGAAAVMSAGWGVWRIVARRDRDAGAA